MTARFPNETLIAHIERVLGTREPKPLKRLMTPAIQADLDRRANEYLRKN